MKNNYEIRGSEVAIFLNYKGSAVETIISIEAFEKANSFPNTWSAHKCSQSENIYCVGKLYNVNGKKEKWIQFHRFLLDAQKGKVIDHINHNTLDNRRENLRELEHYQNMQNRQGVTTANRSGIRGVGLHKASGKWRARATIKGKQFQVGLFETKEEAGQAVSEFRKKHLKYSNE